MPVTIIWSQSKTPTFTIQLMQDETLGYFLPFPGQQSTASWNHYQAALFFIQMTPSFI